MRQRPASLVLVVCLVAASGQAQQTPREIIESKPQVRAGRPAGAPEGGSTVRYDPGSPADGFLSGSASLPYLGNRFDTRSGSPLGFPFTITQLSWYHHTNVGTGTFYPTLAFLVFAPVGGAVTTYRVASGVAAETFNYVGNLGWQVSGAFFGGLNARAGTFANVGMRSASTNGQGFHGVERSDLGGVSNTLPGQNLMVRVSGDLVIPVELTEFEVD